MIKVIEYDKSRYDHSHANEFINQYPELRNYKVILAGGIWTTIRKVSDYDLFVYGDCDPRKIASIIAGSTFQNIIIWNGGITVKKDNKKYQIIIRGFQTYMDVLNDFDITASRVGYDFYTGQLIEHSDYIETLNSGIIDIKKCNIKNNFSTRIDKYLRKKLFTISNLDLQPLNHNHYLADYDDSPPIIYKIINGYVANTYYTADYVSKNTQFFKYCDTIDELLSSSYFTN